MIFLWITLGVVGVLFVCIIWLLVSPVRIVVDSGQRYCSLSMWRLLKATVAWNTDEDWAGTFDKPTVRISVFFKTWRVYPGKPGNKKKKKAKKRQPKKKRRKKKPGKRFTWRMVRIIWKSMGNLKKTFKIKEGRVDVDLMDPFATATMTPIAGWLRTKGIPVYTNFSGKIQVYLIVENRLYRIAWVLLKTYIKLKRN